MSLLVFLTILVAFFGGMMVLLALTGQRMSRKLKSMDAASQVSDAGVRELVARGDINEAVDLYRRFTGVDLFTAKRAIQAMESELRLGTSEPEIRRLLRLGDKAGAIATYQQATGESLAEALAAVEAMELRKGR